MLLQQIAMRRSVLRLYPNQAFCFHQLKNSVHACRTKTTATSISPLPSASLTRNSTKKTVYPESLLIYHAGTGRTVILGCFKVSTIFIFTYFCLAEAPAQFHAGVELWRIAGKVFLSGMMPFLVFSSLSSSFVCYMHLRLPAFARQSREMLARYSKNLPKNAEVDITTMNLIGRPRVSRMKVSELYPHRQSRFAGYGNYARDTTEANAKRPWWMGKAPRFFSIPDGTSKIPGAHILKDVKRRIEMNQIP